MMIKSRRFFFISFLFICISVSGQEKPSRIDTMEFQKGFPGGQSALDQLRSYPSPRYKPGNTHIRLFNWMSTRYMAGGGQPGAKEPEIIKTALLLQEELILNWNYFLTIHNSNTAANLKACKDPRTLINGYIQLANKHPEVPLGITTFWVQLSPPQPAAFKTPNILRKDFPDSFYIKDASGKVIKKVLHFAAPDSIFIADGKLQRARLENILSQLTRPINLISENGEEPPGVTSLKVLSEDKDMKADKEQLRIESWKQYAAVKKTRMRSLYSSQFMSLKGMENTTFTIYNVEGGPIDRFNWEASKRACSKIKGNYYSTPDFYPRSPDNWKTWRGAWHGWKWINDGRKVEIKSGDRFFSPFIAAGWSYLPKQDIRPAQWLGLLKCLSVVGAEFYYTGYFNLKAPYSKPENYVWQAAVPAYAQAISTYYADVFFQGNVLFDEKKEPIVTYPVEDDDVLVAVRKHDSKEKYVIAATVQPGSNTETFPLVKTIHITLAGENIALKARRQGSVYVYDKSVQPALFYQLDRWHQYEHPSRWRSEWINECEVFDSSSTSPEKLIRSIYLREGNKLDVTYAESYVELGGNDWTEYHLAPRNSANPGSSKYLHLYVKCTGGARIQVGTHQQAVITRNGWQWVIIPLPAEIMDGGKMRITAINGNILMDKMIVSDNAVTPSLGTY